MEALKALKERRTVRKFANKPVSAELFDEITECARLAPYPANIQPLKFAVITEKSESLFKYTKWAGYLENGTPSESERPFGYIVTLGDKNIKKNADFETEASIAGAVMSVAAHALGLGTCWLGAIDREGIKKELEIPECFDVLYLLAVGYPAQESTAVEMGDSIKYYLSGEKLCVPKRSREEIIYTPGKE